MNGPAAEQPVRLNPAAAFGSWLLCTLACAAAPWAGAPLGLWKTEVSFSAMLGSILVSGIMLIGLLAMAPWACRTPSAWSTRWLAATVIRFVGTPFLAQIGRAHV